MPHDRGSGPYEDGKPLTHTSKHQKIANESWPERDKNGTPHARNVREQPASAHVAVEARIDFDIDGECWVPGIATRWHGRSVFVEVGDVRVIGRHVWVDAGDVRRV